MLSQMDELGKEYNKNPEEPSSAEMQKHTEISKNPTEKSEIYNPNVQRVYEPDNDPDLPRPASFDPSLLGMRNMDKGAFRLPTISKREVTEQCLSTKCFINYADANVLMNTIVWRINLNENNLPPDQYNLSKLVQNNIVGALFERLNYFYSANGPKVLTPYTTEADNDRFANSEIKSFYSIFGKTTKEDFIRKISPDQDTQNEFRNKITMPDGLLATKRGAITGFMECKCYTPEEVTDLANNPDSIQNLANSLLREIAFINELKFIQKRNRNREANLDSPIVLLRFPDGSSEEDLATIGNKLKELGIKHVVIQTVIDFSAEEVSDLGESFVRSQLARINSSDKIDGKIKDQLNKFAGVSSNDARSEVVDTLIGVVPKDSDKTDEGLRNLLRKSLE